MAGYPHHDVYEDDDTIAFLNRHPTRRCRIMVSNPSNLAGYLPPSGKEPLVQRLPWWHWGLCDQREQGRAGTAVTACALAQYGGVKVLSDVSLG